MDAREALKACFVDTFQLDAETNVETLEYQSIGAWDSVGHMQLIAALETTFDIMIDTQDVLDMSSFGKAVEIMRKYDVVV
ncbi:MAG TPA: acyl carrier protein [Azospirillum sp.]|nr:acyl carrier protein [Azospirillum sp.]